MMLIPVLRSRPFFGRLRLQMAKVPKRTPALTYLGRSGSSSRQKKAAPGKKRQLQSAPAPYTKIFHFKLSKS